MSFESEDKLRRVDIGVSRPTASIIKPGSVCGGEGGMETNLSDWC